MQAASAEDLTEAYKILKESGQANSVADTVRLMWGMDSADNIRAVLLEDGLNENEVNEAIEQHMEAMTKAAFASNVPPFLDSEEFTDSQRQKILKDTAKEAISADKKKSAPEVCAMLWNMTSNKAMIAVALNEAGYPKTVSERTVQNIGDAVHRIQAAQQVEPTQASDVTLKQAISGLDSKGNPKEDSKKGGGDSQVKGKK